MTLITGEGTRSPHHTQTNLVTKQPTYLILLRAYSSFLKIIYCPLRGLPPCSPFPTKHLLPNFKAIWELPFFPAYFPHVHEVYR